MKSIKPVTSLMLATMALALSPQLQAQEAAAEDNAAPPAMQEQAMPSMNQPHHCMHDKQGMKHGAMGGYGRMMPPPEMREQMMQRRQAMMQGDVWGPNPDMQARPPMMPRGWGGDGPMQHNPQRQAMKQEMRQRRMEHMQRMEQRMANIEALLQELVEQKRKAAQ